MEPEGGRGEQKRRPQGGGQGGGQEPAVVHQPEGDDLHLEPVLGGHAAEDAFPEGRVHDGAQDAEVPSEEAGVVLDTVVLLPAVSGVEGAHGAGQKDGGVGLNQHFSGGRSTLLQSCRGKQTRGFTTKCILTKSLQMKKLCLHQDHVHVLH